MNTENDFKEFVVTLYGGDSPWSQKVIAQTELKVRVQETERGTKVWWPKGIKLDQYEADGELYVNRLNHIFTRTYAKGSRSK